MAYTVLARKYRSRTFDEVVGQEPIATTLASAIRAGRIHHGYLFTGTRGVGKTSMARILAKALNCLKADGPTPTPCLECDVCKSIAEGQDLDVLEIDAASNTGVDNIRELRENTAYRPARSRFKVYIIDEVHMLSTGAFNALLKTLEEPPEHVKFILATTEIQKVPATIQSRCQRFNFRSIGPEAIAARLADIVKSEGATAEPAVLQRVARLANGSMRDALSLLDQLLAVGPKLTAALLDEVLPPAHDEQVFGLMEQLAAGAPAATLAQAEATLASGRGLDLLCTDLVELCRNLMLLRACGAETPLADVPLAARAAYVRLAQTFELSQYVQMIGLLEELRRSVRFSGAGRALLDAGLVRLAHLRQWTPIEQVLAQHLGAAGSDEKKKSVADAAGPGGPALQGGVSAPPPMGGTGVSPVMGGTGVSPVMGGTGVSPAMGGTGVSPVALPARGGTGAAVSPVLVAPAGLRGPALQTPVAPRPARPASVAVAPASAIAPAAVVPPTPVSSADQARIREHPLVRQALELFNGTIVNIEQRAAGNGADNEAD
jgi:DNA polymerase-3 subunit gamma/tau